MKAVNEATNPVTIKVLNGVNLILKYDPNASFTTSTCTVYFGGSYWKIHERMTQEEQHQMKEWGWFEDLGMFCIHV
ncbi:MAG TPA: hypothetical protein VIQ31_03280 [Phormidium sp.]